MPAKALKMYIQSSCNTHAIYKLIRHELYSSLLQPENKSQCLFASLFSFSTLQIFGCQMFLSG